MADGAQLTPNVISTVFQTELKPINPIVQVLKVEIRRKEGDTGETTRTQLTLSDGEHYATTCMAISKNKNPTGDVFLEPFDVIMLEEYLVNWLSTSGKKVLLVLRFAMVSFPKKIIGQPRPLINADSSPYPEVAAPSTAAAAIKTTVPKPEEFLEAVMEDMNNEVESWRHQLRNFLLGQPCYSFLEAYNVFARLMMTLDPNYTPKTTTDQQLDTKDLETVPAELPKQISHVVTRVHMVSAQRREAVHLIMKKLCLGANVFSEHCFTVMMTGNVTDRDRKFREFWEHDEMIQSRQQMERTMFPYLADGATRLEIIEQEMFKAAKNDAAVYTNLLLNQMFYLFKIWKDNLDCEMTPFVTNSGTQTEESFLRAGQRTLELITKEQILNNTDEDFDLAMKNNRIRLAMARNLVELSLRHAFTQTLDKIPSGYKTKETESSPKFDWMELCPNPVRYFPLIDKSTEIDEKELISTKKIQKSGEAYPFTAGSKFNSTEYHIGIVEQFLPRANWIGRNHECRIANTPGFLEDVYLGFQVGGFLQEDRKGRSSRPYVEPGRCPTHKKGPVVSGNLDKCQSCTVASLLPPPWASNLQFALSLIHQGTDLYEIVHLHNTQPETTVKSERFLQEFIWLHFVRKFLTKQDVGNKTELGHYGLRCLCLSEKQATFMSLLAMNQKRKKKNPGQFKEALSALTMEREHLHLCNHCSAREGLFEEFKCCVKCKKEKLFVKAFYCSLGCSIKDWRHHQLLHMAFSVARDQFFQF